MKTLLVAGSAGTVLALWLALPGSAQDPDAGRGLVRVEPTAPPAGVPATTETEDLLDGEAWARRLSEPSLALREVHFEQVVEQALRDPALHQWLRERAADEARVELAWTARLALRAVEGARRAGLGVFERLPMRGLAPDIDALRRQVEESLRGARPELDALFERFGFGRAGGLGSLFDELDPGALAPPGVGGTHSSRSVSVQQDEHGCRVEVRELVDGEEVVQEYSGGSLEEILRAHPELEGELGLQPGGGLSLRIGGDARARRGLPPPQRALAAPANPAVLGVYVGEVSDARRTRLGLAPGEGVYVLGTEPGTYAHMLGIAPGDVVLELNGVRLGGVDSIAAVMSQRRPDDELTVVWFDTWGKRRQRGWRQGS